MGGNGRVNAIFEATCVYDSVKPNAKNNCSTDDRRNFIHEKYEHRNFFDPAGYASCTIIEVEDGTVDKKSGTGVLDNMLTNKKKEPATGKTVGSNSDCATPKTVKSALSYEDLFSPNPLSDSDEEADSKNQNSNNISHEEEEDFFASRQQPQRQQPQTDDPFDGERRNGEVNGASSDDDLFADSATTASELFGAAPNFKKGRAKAPAFSAFEEGDDDDESSNNLSDTNKLFDDKAFPSPEPAKTQRKSLTGTSNGFIVDPFSATDMPTSPGFSPTASPSKTRGLVSSKQQHQATADFLSPTSRKMHYANPNSQFRTPMKKDLGHVSRKSAVLGSLGIWLDEDEDDNGNQKFGVFDKVPSTPPARKSHSFDQFMSPGAKSLPTYEHQSSHDGVKRSSRGDTSGTGSKYDVFGFVSPRGNNSRQKPSKRQSTSTRSSRSSSNKDGVVSNASPASSKDASAKVRSALRRSMDDKLLSPKKPSSSNRRRSSSKTKSRPTGSSSKHRRNRSRSEESDGSNRSRRSVQTAPSSGGEDVDQFDFAVVEATPNTARSRRSVQPTGSSLEEFLGITSPGHDSSNTFGVKTGEASPTKIERRNQKTGNSDPVVGNSLDNFLFKELEEEVIEKIEPESDEISEMAKPRIRISEEARKSAHGQRKLVMKGGVVVEELSRRESSLSRDTKNEDDILSPTRRRANDGQEGFTDQKSKGSMSSRRRYAAVEAQSLKADKASSGRERRSMRALESDAKKTKSVRRKSAPAQSCESVDSTWDVQLEQF